MSASENSDPLSIRRNVDVKVLFERMRSLLGVKFKQTKNIEEDILSYKSDFPFRYLYQ